ncbi:MAG: ATP-binding cassette domain-containing protein [Candidatus Omnitrophota bacterium]
MITVEGLCKAFNGNKVLDKVSFEVPAGELVALMGLSGTGKSVLLLHIIGLMSPDAGRIVVDGTEVTGLPESKLLVFRRKIGYLFQDSALYDFMTVGENIAFPLKEHGTLSAKGIRAKVDEHLKLVDLDGAFDKYPSELSGGMRKRAALARALVMEVKVLLCDEPTSGLDPIRSRDISLLIRDLSKKTGCTTIVTSHDAVNAFRIADRAFVLNEGRLAAQGSERDIRSSRDPFIMDFFKG